MLLLGERRIPRQQTHYYYLLSAAGEGSGQGAGTVEKVTVSTDKCPPPRRESVLTKHRRDTPAAPGEAG